MNPSTTPPSSTPDAVLAGAAEGAEPPDALDALLRQIVGGYFVLTDGQGAVSKWSEPAELLFGRESEEILGQGFFETLIGGDLPPAGQAWRGFLDLGEPPRAPGTVQLVGRNTDGTEFPMAAVFVPVKLDEGFDFSLFLEDLSFELPMNLMLLRMRQQHPVVVRALRQAIAPAAQPWEGWRTAGTLIVFTPLSATPWVDEELARRQAEREAADAEAEERLTNPDPGIQGSVADLDDAAAVVARLLSALERIDELERVANSLPAQLDEARRVAEERAARAEQTLREELGGVQAGSDLELLSRVDRLERARMDGEQQDADRRRAFVAAESAQAQLAARLDQLERAREREREAARAELEGALERIERVQRETDAVREQLSAEQGLAGDDRRRLEELRRESEALRTRMDGMREQAEAARAQAAELAELRGVVERQAAAAERLARAEELDALREEIARREAAEAELRQDAQDVAGQLAGLREAIGRQEAGAQELADARRARAERDAQIARELADLRAQVARQEAAGGRAAEPEAVREEVQSLVGDAQTQLAALHARIEVLADAGREVDALRERIERLAGRDELDGIREELRTLASRGELDRLYERLDELDGRDQALRDRLDGFAGRDELTGLREGLQAVAGRDEVHALRERVDALAAQDGITELNRRLDELPDAGEALRLAREALSRIDEVDRGAGSVLDDVHGLRADVARLGGELETARGRISRAEAEALGAGEAAATAAREDAARARDESAALRRELETAADERAAALRAELAQVRDVAEAANRGLQELRGELAGFRALRQDAAAARDAAKRSNEKVEAMQAEVAFAISNLEELKQGLSSAGQAAVIARREAEQARKAAQIVGDGSTERVTEVFQQILGLAAARNAGQRRPAPAVAKKPEPVKRESRHGFDDVSTPMAILALDGKFKELNPAFSRLVGYQEHEFAKAAWPSPHDRRDYKDQLEQLRRLGAGELTSVAVSSTYMHGQGLMVPVVGKLSLELGEDGLPLRLLLEAEDRHTS